MNFRTLYNFLELKQKRKTKKMQRTVSGRFSAHGLTTGHNPRLIPTYVAHTRGAARRWARCSRLSGVDTSGTQGVHRAHRVGLQLTMEKGQQ
jgi:hypothetical protein